MKRRQRFRKEKESKRVEGREKEAKYSAEKGGGAEVILTQRASGVRRVHKHKGRSLLADKRKANRAREIVAESDEQVKDYLGKFKMREAM